MAAVPKGHQRGTHRMVAPATTLARIRPHLASFGITRCADITGLDCIGIPVYVAVRPQGRILQTSNGKGLTEVDAQVSALMEAIEHWHAEHPVAPLRRACRAELTAERRPVLSPRGLEGGPIKGRVDRLALDWVEGVELVSGEPAWIPAYVAAYHRDQPFAFSYNGLASGNHPVEATLHALYEVIERDSLARLSARGQVRLERCGVIDLDEADGLGDEVGGLVERIRRADLQLVLLHVPTAGDVHTLMAVLLDPSAFSGASMVNFGTGAHLSPTVAAIRAITEAAQSRLTFIHGSREDLTERAYTRGANHEAMLGYFSALSPDTPWSALADRASDGLHADLARVLSTIPCAYAADLGQGKAGVSAMKVIVPGAKLADWI
ncbi:MAG: YcaO-like family protein [Deltaproteobacteria bacterium]|nr:YcaO-like family protein [Deltaproteobacteria bacterium]